MGVGTTQPKGAGGLTDVPSDVRRFIASNIDSVGQLETLLLLRGERNRAWRVEEVSTSLYTPAETASMYLEHLYERELLRRDERDNGPVYAYDPHTSKVEQVVHAVANIYSTRRHAVVALIVSTPSDQVQSFADAFKFRKDK